MKHTYILKPFKKNEKLDEMDKQRRAKVEATLNKKLSDAEWLRYKIMVIPKKK